MNFSGNLFLEMLPSIKKPPEKEKKSLCWFLDLKP